MSLPHLPVTIIGGYLGSGKTTLVNHLLRHANGRKLAVMVNEFGELPIDEDLIEAEGDDLISIAGGCVCCSFGDDLSAALMDIAALEPRPDHVLIECSGVAMPGAIQLSLGLLEGFEPDGVVILADTVNVRTNAADEYIGDTITRQLSAADIVVLSKRDLVSDAQAQETENWIVGITKGAEIITATQGRVDPNLLLGLNATQAPRAATQGHADRLFSSIVFDDLGPVPKATIADIVAKSFGIVRAKGFVKAGDGKLHEIQVVGRTIDVRPASESNPVGLVFIGIKGRFDVEGLRQFVSNRD